MLALSAASPVLFAADIELLIGAYTDGGFVRADPALFALLVADPALFALLAADGGLFAPFIAD